MTPPSVLCCLGCGELVIVTHSTWRRITAFERPGSVRASGAHGGSDITLRQPIAGEYAHDHCVGRAKAGLLHQASLL